MDSQQSEEHFAKSYSVAQLTKNKLLLQAFYSQKTPKVSSKSHSQAVTQRTMRSSSLTNTYKKLPAKSLSPGKIPAVSSANKQLAQRKTLNKNLTAIRAFFYTALRCFDCKVPSKWLMNEVANVKEILYSPDKVEEKRMESAVKQIQSLSSSSIPDHLRDSLLQLAGKVDKPYLPKAEAFLLEKNAEISTKYLVHIAKVGFSDELFLAFFAILSAANPVFYIKNSKVNPIVHDICKQFLANPGLIIQTAKKVPEALRNLKFDFDMESKAKKFYKKNKATEDKIIEFVKESFKLAKIYRTLNGVKKPKKRKFKEVKTVKLTVQKEEKDTYVSVLESTEQQKFTNNFSTIEKNTEETFFELVTMRKNDTSINSAYSEEGKAHETAQKQSQNSFRVNDELQQKTEDFTPMPTHTLANDSFSRHEGIEDSHFCKEDSFSKRCDSLSAKEITIDEKEESNEDSFQCQFEKMFNSDKSVVSGKDSLEVLGHSRRSSIKLSELVSVINPNEQSLNRSQEKSFPCIFSENSSEQIKSHAFQDTNSKTTHNFTELELQNPKRFTENSSEKYKENSLERSLDLKVSQINTYPNIQEDDVEPNSLEILDMEIGKSFEKQLKTIDLIKSQSHVEHDSNSVNKNDIQLFKERIKKQLDDNETVRFRMENSNPLHNRQCKTSLLNAFFKRENASANAPLHTRMDRSSEPKTTLRSKLRESNLLSNESSRRSNKRPIEQAIRRKARSQVTRF